MVRDGILAGPTSSISTLVWEDATDQMEDGTFCTLTNCKMGFCYGKCLATSQNTLVSKADSEDNPQSVKTRPQNLLCCPEIMNIEVNSYLVCYNKDLQKIKLSPTAGALVVKFHSFNKFMLIKNCYFDISVHFNLEKDDKLDSVVAFPKVINSFISEDVVQYRDNTDTLLKHSCVYKM